MSKKGERVSYRMCVGCRAMRPKGELLRLVRTPKGELMLDETGSHDGRGAYICRDPGCYKAALKKRAFERALSVSLREDVVGVIEKRLSDG